jgi:hypothetical protein
MNTHANPFLIRPTCPEAVERARAWLWLATLAVAASSLFAILIVLARVPAIGALFPGTQFYRVALTLHVDLSQLVWFSSFAGLLWSLAANRRGRRTEKLALGLCGLGVLAMALAPALGAVTPVMSNYLPVLDSRLFLTGLFLFAAGLGLQAWRGLELWPRRSADGHDICRAGLALAAGAVLLSLVLLPWSYLQLADVDGAAFFEALFWASGHVWEFALTALLMLAWLALAALAAPDRLPAATTVRRLLVAGALPLAVALLIQIRHPVLSGAYRAGFTDLMRYASWEAPLLLGLILLGVTWRRGQIQTGWPLAVLRLSLGLFVAGLLLGATITTQTTVITAHYHGTIGAVTLGLMGYTYALLPALDLGSPAGRLIRRQTVCYGLGNLLMMVGLAGAGWMGAPRKAPGNVSFEFGFESLSRLVMGLGGTLALLGILGFFWLVMRELRPVRPVGQALVTER